MGRNKLPKILLPDKPKYISLTTDTDFYGLFQKIETSFSNCYILESLGEQSFTSRYSVIGFDPEHIISARKNSLYFDGKEYEVANPYHALKEIFPKNIISKNYAGGMVGYIAYEAINYFEKQLNLPEHKDFELFKFGVYTDGLVFDKVTGEIFYYFYKKNRSKKVRELLAQKVKKNLKPQVEFLGHTLNKAQHQQIVTKVIEEIKAGNTFQCEVGFKSEYKIKGEKLPIYTELRKVNPSPHMYYLKFDEQVIVGASPELLLRLRQGELETFPLAGTIKRGFTPAEDIKLARTLLNDPKEIAEHNMLIDLHRNDLGKVSRFGTVKVRNSMDIKRFSHVQHISSEVVGVIRREEDLSSALAAVMPAGTLSGAPKIESIKIIAKNEKTPRGPYGGALGQFGFNGDCTFAIPIRTLFLSGDDAYTQTCGGIVYDSDPDKEYQEIINKLAAMQIVLDKFVKQ